jgi:hypothetical protein
MGEIQRRAVWKRPEDREPFVDEEIRVDIREQLCGYFSIMHKSKDLFP